MKPEYRHQCRYCSYCVYTLEESWWCDEKSEYIPRPKSPNRCARFLFNEIPADKTLDGKPYQQRSKRQFVQEKLFYMPTDRQRARRIR